jgi:hypothetical protein
MFSLIEIQSRGFQPIKALGVGASGGYIPSVMGVLVGNRMVTVMPSLDSCSYKMLSAAPCGIRTHNAGKHQVLSFKYFMYNNEQQREEVFAVVVVEFPATEHDSRLVSEILFQNVEVDISLDKVKDIFKRYGYEEGQTE